MIGARSTALATSPTTKPTTTDQMTCGRLVRAPPAGLPLCPLEHEIRHPDLPAPGLDVIPAAEANGLDEPITSTTGQAVMSPSPVVEKPELRKVPIQFYEVDAARRIVEAQPDLARRALMALLYRTGAEVSVALKLTGADVDPAAKRIRAAGTKTYTRDRMARVADWAWPLFWSYAKGHLPTARLWRESLTRFTVSDWHRETVKALELPAYPLKNARHHWAVRMLRVELRCTSFRHNSGTRQRS
jgi:integrase